MKKFFQKQEKPFSLWIMVDFGAKIISVPITLSFAYKECSIRNGYANFPQK